MGRVLEDTTARRLLAAYDTTVEQGSSAELADEARRMREAFQRRTGVFHPDDAWFEGRSRAFWDDALTVQGFAARAAPRLPEDLRGFARRLSHAHRGVFAVEDAEGGGARLVDLWSGVELWVRALDEAQAVDLEHAEGLVDARVVAGDDAGPLYVLPGALFHAPDATEPARRVLAAARERDMSGQDALDALLRMELVLRSSSRVKASFAYRVESLPRT